MKHSNILKFFIILILIYGANIGAQLTCKNFTSLPDSNFWATDSIQNKRIHIYDRYGNKYALARMNHKYFNTNPIAMEMEGSLARPIANKCSAGLFTIHFVEEVTAGYGFDNATYRNLVCKVFQDISAMLVDVNPTNPGRVNIFVASDSTFPIIRPGASFGSGELGYGSSFYTLSTPVNDVFADNVAYQTIKLGRSAYSNLPSLIIPEISDGYYHGYLAINFKGVNYNTNYNTATIANNELDMYTAILHEALHILGIASGIDGNFSSIFGNNIYTRFDENLYKNAITSKLLTHNAAQTSISNTSGLANANHSCSTPNNFIFTGTNLSNQSIYNSTTWMPGTNLSHLGCTGAGACNTSYAQPSSDYVMNPCIDLGSSYIKRHPNPNEYKVLCDLGYSLTGIYGNSAPPSVGIYTLYPPCTPPCIAVGENDVLTTEYMTAISLNSILNNDLPANSQIVRVALFDTSKGTISRVGNNFTFTPARFVTGKVYLVYYIKCGANSQMSSPIYITVQVKPSYVPPPPPCIDNNECNLVCQGDYEASLYADHWSNFIIDSAELSLIHAKSSPDLFIHENGSLCYYNAGDNLPESCNRIGSACRNTIPGPNLPHPKGGKQYMGMGFMSYTPFFFEGVQHRLRKAMLPGKKYKIRFLARVMETRCSDPVIEVYGDSMSPCAPPMATKRIGTSQCGYTARKLATSGSIISTTWTQYTFNNVTTSTKITNIFIAPMRKISIIDWGYVNIDNVEIIEDSIIPLKVTSNFNTSNPCLSSIHSGIFKVCLDSTVQDTNSRPINVKLILPKGFKLEAGSSFSSQGVYTIPIGEISKSNCIELLVKYSMDDKTIKADSSYSIALKAIDSSFCTSTESNHVVSVSPVNKPLTSPISITKSISKSHAKPGDIVTITLKVCNHSNQKSDTIHIIDTISSNMLLGTSTGFTVSGNTLIRVDVIDTNPRCKTYTYTVMIMSNDASLNCVTVNSHTNNCILAKDCIRINDIEDVCIHKIAKFQYSSSSYSIVPNASYQVISQFTDSFFLKFNKLGNQLVIISNGGIYDTIPVQVILPQPYIAVSQNLICNSDFPPTGDNANARLTEGKCQKVCENSCVWYYAGSYSVYKDRVFKWKVQGAKNINASTTVIADSILICWGSDTGSLQLIEESIDGCADTFQACIEILKVSGAADFGVLPNVQDSIYFLCEDQEINFKDTSTIRNASDLESWCWDFGDGYFRCGDVSLDGLPASVFDYTYSKYGTFQVKLSYTTKCGCEISKTKTIVIDSGIKMNVYCKNPVCPLDTVEYFADSLCPPPYSWSVTNGIIIGANNNARVLVQWGDPTDGIGILTLIAPPGCNVCNPVQTLKVNILPSNPDVVYPLSACAGESVTHTGIQMSSAKYGWRDMSSSVPKDSIYYQNFIVPSSTIAGSSFANYIHHMFLFDKYNQLKCSSVKLYTTRIKDTFQWIGPDTTCVDVSASYAMNPAIKSADTIEITGGSLTAPVLLYGMGSFAYTFPQSGIYFIKAKDDLLCDKESCVKEVVVLTKPAKSDTITGKTSVCINDLEIYRSSPKQSGTKLSWIVPAGDLLINASGDYAQVKFTSGGIKKLGVIASYLQSPYCSSDTTWLTIASNASMASLLGDTIACANDTSIFELSDNSGYNYSWRLIPATGMGSIVKLSDSKVKLAWNDISANTSLTLRVEFSVCGLDTFAQKSINLIASPKPDIIGKDTVCIGSSGSYTSSLVSSSTPAYYSWTGTGLQITGQSQVTDVTFPKTGSYILNLFTRTGMCKALKKASKNIIVLPRPTTIVTTVPACNKLINIAHGVTGTLAIIGNGRYRITNPFFSTSPSFTVNVNGSNWAGTYTIYDSLTGCSIQAPVTYEPCQEINNNNGRDTNTCNPDPTNTISLSFNTQCGNLNYTYNNPSGKYIDFELWYKMIPSKLNRVGTQGGFSPGIYDVTFYAWTADNCQFKLDTTFAITLEAGMDASVLCENNTRKIFLRDKSTFIEPYYIKTRNWTIKKGTTTVATGTGASYTSPALSAGTYTAYLAVTNDSNHTCYDTQTVTIDSLRVSFTVDKTQICEDGVVKFTSASPDSAKIAIYNWDFGDLTSQENKYGIKQYNYKSTSYKPKLEITDYIGCKHSSAVIEIITQSNNLKTTKPSFALSANNICADQVPISATVNALHPNRSPYLYKWSQYSEYTTSYSSINTSGIYHVKVVDKYGCEGFSAPVPVQIYLKPEIEVAGKERICLGDKIDLYYDAGTANLVFNPMTGVSGNQIIYQPSSAGTYPITAIATNAAGCADTLVKDIIVDPKPNLSLMQTTKSCRPYEVTLTATGSNPRSPLTSAYLWTHGPNQSVINVRQGGDYYMKFADANGCKAMDSMKVEKELRFLNFPEGCFEVCQDVTNSKPVVFDLSFDRPAYDAWTWYRNDVSVASGVNSRPTNPWTINYPVAGSFKYHLSLTHKGCTIVSPPIYIVVLPQPCTFRKMAYNTNGTSPRIYPSKEKDLDNYREWSLYPSPASNKLFIQSNFSLKNKEIVIYSMTGVVMYRGAADAQPINLSRFTSGVYLAQLLDGGKLLGKQTFVVEKE